jgi:hypothetical protein
MPGTPSDPGTLFHFELSLKSKPSKDGVIVYFTGIPGNRPQDFGNSVALWDNWYPDPEFHKPLKVTLIGSNLQPAGVRIENETFQENDYLVTYQVAAAMTSMCASLRISARPAAMSEPSNSVILRLSSVSASSVSVFYSTLGGYLPAKYRNWIGIWRGFPNPFRAGKPMGAVPIPDDSTEGSVTIGNISIESTRNYTLIYFMGGGVSDQPGTNAGAMLSFTAS